MTTENPELHPKEDINLKLVDDIVSEATFVAVWTYAHWHGWRINPAATGKLRAPAAEDFRAVHHAFAVSMKQLEHETGASRKDITKAIESQLIHITEADIYEFLNEVSDKSDGEKHGPEHHCSDCELAIVQARGIISKFRLHTLDK